MYVCARFGAAKKLGAPVACVPTGVKHLHHKVRIRPLPPRPRRACEANECTAAFPRVRDGA